MGLLRKGLFSVAFREVISKVPSLTFRAFLVLQASLVGIQKEFAIVKGLRTKIKCFGVLHGCKIPPERTTPTWGVAKGSSTSWVEN